METDDYERDCAWVAGYQASTKGGNRSAKTRFSNRTKKGERKTSISRIAIKNAWEWDTVPENLEADTRPASNLRYIKKKTLTVPASTKLTKRKKTIKLNQRSYPQIAAFDSVNNAKKKPKQRLPVIVNDKKLLHQAY